MPVPKCNQRAVNKYNQKNYDRLNIMVPKGQRDVIKTHAEAHGESLNAFVTRAINIIIGADRGDFIITEANSTNVSPSNKIPDDISPDNMKFW